MFIRAKYAVSRVGRESQIHRLIKSGKDEFLPDFMVRRAVERPGSDRPLHSLIPIEVKYRADIARFWRFEAAEFFESARRWPDLWLVLVTDRPEDGRSCFQALEGADAVAKTTTDLKTVTALDIYASTILEYTHLATKLFGLLAAPRTAHRKARTG